MVDWINPLIADPTKRLPTNCLSVFDHFVKLALKRLKNVYFTEEAYCSEAAT